MAMLTISSCISFSSQAMGFSARQKVSGQPFLPIPDLTNWPLTAKSSSTLISLDFFPTHCSIIVLCRAFPSFFASVNSILFFKHSIGTNISSLKAEIEKISRRFHLTVQWFPCIHPLRNSQCLRNFRSQAHVQHFLPSILHQHPLEHFSQELGVQRQCPDYPEL